MLEYVQDLIFIFYKERLFEFARIAEGATQIFKYISGFVPRQDYFERLLPIVKQAVCAGKLKNQWNTFVSAFSARHFYAELCSCSVLLD